MDEHPNYLLKQYFLATIKLKKFERVVFKRFAPSVSDVLNDFNHLGIKFEDANIFQYAAMCYLGSAKCEKSLGNVVAQVDFYLKSARCFLKANEEREKLFLKSNKAEYIDGALKSYNLALSSLDTNSVIKAGIIREILKINQNFIGTSNFVSSCHQIFELEITASESIKKGDYYLALQKLTDIFDNIQERKKENFYIDVITRSEISCILLLTILNLPPSQHSSIHIKILEKYVINFDFETELSFCKDNNLPIELNIVLSDVVMSWKDKICLTDAVIRLSKFSSLTDDHKLLLNIILNKFI